jgi:hypothetical protein
MIILLGFSKSGTSSFYSLFKKLGFNVYHRSYPYNENLHEVFGMIIKNNKANKKPLLYGIAEDACLTELNICASPTHAYWPQFVDYKQLYYENPGSLFILNKRNTRNLLVSFKNHNNLDERLYKYNPELIEDKTDQGFIKFIENFYVEVEEFFASQPNAKFISYNIERDNIAKLKKYIDIKDIKSFPKENITPIERKKYL